MTFGDIIERERREAERESACQTRVSDILELLEEHGDVSETLRADLMRIKDEEILKQLVKAAAHADNIEAFRLQMPMDL